MAGSAERLRVHEGPAAEPLRRPARDSPKRALLQVGAGGAGSKWKGTPAAPGQGSGGEEAPASGGGQEVALPEEVAVMDEELPEVAKMPAEDDWNQEQEEAGAEEEAMEDGSMAEAGERACGHCGLPFKWVLPSHRAPSAIECSLRGRVGEEMVPALSSMARHLEGERDLGMLEASEENDWRRRRHGRERKNWGRMERMAERIHQEAARAASRAGEAAAALRGRGHGAGYLDGDTILEHGRIQGRMAQAGMIFFAAGAHLIGMAEAQPRDAFHQMHCHLRAELAGQGGYRRCPICGNPSVAEPAEGMVQV